MSSLIGLALSVVPQLSVAYPSLQWHGQKIETVVIHPRPAYIPPLTARISQGLYYVQAKVGTPGQIVKPPTTERRRDDYISSIPKYLLRCIMHATVHGARESPLCFFLRGICETPAVCSHLRIHSKSSQVRHQPQGFPQTYGRFISHSNSSTGTDGVGYTFNDGVEHGVSLPPTCE